MVAYIRPPISCRLITTIIRPIYIYLTIHAQGYGVQDTA